jgi:hypothetical protein
MKATTESEGAGFILRPRGLRLGFSTLPPLSPLRTSLPKKQKLFRTCYV